jgi:hypothetical protein
MRYLHPKLLCLVVPALVVIAYLVLVGVNYLFVSILMEFFPLSALILIPFAIGFAGGFIVPVLAMLWALVCFFLRFDGKTPGSVRSPFNHHFLHLRIPFRRIHSEAVQPSSYTPTP